MLIPHLHFCGDCKQAIDLYENAFNTKAKSIEYAPDGKIVHATMDIHGVEVFLNDNFGNKNKSFDFAVHLIITFETAEELLACYEVLKTDDSDIDTFRETPYSKLCGNFMDEFGVTWGFMASA
jgi:Uncharacterized protein conserved in bacteria